MKLGEYGDIAWGDEDEIGLCQDALYMEITGKTVDEVLPVVSGTIPIYCDCGSERIAGYFLL